MTRWSSRGDVPQHKIEEAVERVHEQELARYEKEVDRLSREQELCPHGRPADVCECERPFADADSREAA